jgi:hypothetical protein
MLEVPKYTIFHSRPTRPQKAMLLFLSFIFLFLPELGWTQLLFLLIIIQMNNTKK